MDLEVPARVGKVIAVYAIVKGIALGLTVTAVIHASGLSTFAQGIIIAVVSATIGALGMIIAAIIAARYAQEQRQRATRMEQQLSDVHDKLTDGDHNDT